MLRQIKYFQAVVRNNSFSEAAEECHISQSAISQQIKALENELGFQLLERNNRKFILTPAGEHFYKKSLILISDYERICRESEKIAFGKGIVFKIGYLRNHSSREVHLALKGFSEKYPQITVQVLYGNHEELFTLLRNGGADLVLNDQRRAFSDEYVNMILSTNHMYIEISVRNTIAKLRSVTAEELKDIPCILVASKEQREIEREYFQTVIGFQGDFLYAENLEEARLLVISGQGFMPVESNDQFMNFGNSLCRVPLYRGERQITSNYCLFWKKDNSNYYIEEFSEILKSKFV